MLRCTRISGDAVMGVIKAMLKALNEDDLQWFIDQYPQAPADVVEKLFHEKRVSTPGVAQDKIDASAAWLEQKG